MTATDYRTETVLITGASAGIGSEFARRLAERGDDVILVARREDRLEALAAELRAAHGVTAVPVALDLTAPAAGERLRAEVARRGLVVTSVINNAGFGTEGLFAEEDPERLRAEIAVNIAAVVDIARAFIGDLHARASGFLINVASMAAYVASPRMAVYAATKAFVLSFTEALWYEHRGTGVKVFALSPGATETEFFHVLGNDGADGGLGRQTAAEVVDAALRALDGGAREPSVVTSGRNRASVGLLRLLGRRRALEILGRLTARAA